MTHYSHCGLRLGDNLAALHLLRKLAIAHPDHKFVHAARVQYLNQMLEVVFDLENIKLIPFGYQPENSLDLWKNAGGFWENHPKKNDYAEFMLIFFGMMAQEMKLESPLKTWRDLLFDYPAIHRAIPCVQPFDVLVVNSPPMSGQALRYNIEHMDYLVSDLAKKYKLLLTHKSRIEGTVCTSDYGLTVTDIGNCSLFCKGIVMVSTGAAWITHNAFNLESVELRVIILENERHGLGPNEVHVKDVAGAKNALLERKWL